MSKSSELEINQNKNSNNNKSLTSMLFDEESIKQIFSLLDKDSNGEISIEEAKSVILRINSRLNRSYGEENIKEFFQLLANNKAQASNDETTSSANGIPAKITFDEFRAAFTTFL